MHTSKFRGASPDLHTVDATQAHPTHLLICAQAEARPAHATAWALLPDPAARRGLQAALAQVAAARPPPGWAVAVLAGDRSARVARRYGNDVGAARAAAQKAVDEAAVVDAATRNALAALV